MSSAHGGQPFRVLVSGASGMVGRALIAALSVPSAVNRFRPEVFRLVRRPPTSPFEIQWCPMSQNIDLARCEGFDAVVHLAGENVGSGDGLLAFTGRWTDAKRHRILESRRRGTQLIAQACGAVSNKPRVLVAASGAGFYGLRRGDELLDEASPKGSGFLAEVADVWEASTAPATRAGVRVVNLRFGMILSREDGALGECAGGGMGDLQRVCVRVVCVYFFCVGMSVVADRPFSTNSLQPSCTGLFSLVVAGPSARESSGCPGSR